MHRLHCPHCKNAIDIRAQVVNETQHGLMIEVHVRSHHKPKAKKAKK